MSEPATAIAEIPPSTFLQDQWVYLQYAQAAADIHNTNGPSPAPNAGPHQLMSDIADGNWTAAFSMTDANMSPYQPAAQMQIDTAGETAATAVIRTDLQHTLLNMQQQLPILGSPLSGSGPILSANQSAAAATFWSDYQTLSTVFNSPEYATLRQALGAPLVTKMQTALGELGNYLQQGSIQIIPYVPQMLPPPPSTYGTWSGGTWTASYSWDGNATPSSLPTASNPTTSTTLGSVTYTFYTNSGSVYGTCQLNENLNWQYTFNSRGTLAAPNQTLSLNWNINPSCLSGTSTAILGELLRYVLPIQNFQFAGSGTQPPGSINNTLQTMLQATGWTPPHL